jgi:glycosyltransferase involved in cell wall biosynthesis
MASPFLGGPERQVLGLAKALPAGYRTTFLSFAERGLARPFLDRARQEGFEAIELGANFPRVDRAIAEVADLCRRLGAHVLCCSGYKPDLIGWRAGRRVGLPVVAIAHGWTGITLKVRLYEVLDGLAMRWMDGVVCVSQAMATKVRRAGVSTRKIRIIRNAIDPTPFASSAPNRRHLLEAFFSNPPRQIVGAAGRLSVEKGFDVLIEAAANVCDSSNDVGFLIFGEGPMRPQLEQRIRELGLAGRVVLGGFRTDLEHLLGGLDLAVLSSHTEGLPVAVLEAQAAGVPVVATAVGGTPEVIQEGITGYLVPPANPPALAEKIRFALNDEARLHAMGQHAQQRVGSEFTFAQQALRYQELFARLASSKDRGKVSLRSVA